VPVRITENGPTVPKPKDAKPTDKFLGLSERCLLANMIPTITANAYDTYCPSQKDNVKKLICMKCEIQFTSAAAVTRHKRGGGCEDASIEVDDSDTEDELEVVEEEDEAPMMNIFDLMKNPEFIADL